eukprot:CAMPEP_0116104644 /NCGR_PEP_ID=MMETSP0327-20121206/14573_1 /TAXON_ID=44447 /ORGANISM="Pseudo-nitzschia delicatissima, Strain B596" /LENGTH=202 /DNA_ID=CAMNT_0003596925 /DNA_START=43 /DNA_END=648 /DNA_ORIENTATION=+
MSSLPIGWENRSNRMSEKDMKLGGIAATKFIDKSLSTQSGNTVTPENNAYSGATSGIYQNSNQVREHYLRQIEHSQQQQQQQKQDDSPFASGNRHHGNQSSTPMFWEERQQMRQLEAEGFRNQKVETPGGAFGTSASPQPKTKSSRKGTTASSAEVALVKVATHALESLADVLEQDTNGVQIPMDDRTAFAKAIQRAMQALT